MKKILFSLLFSLFTVSFAQASTPSDDSIIQLLILQEVDKAPALVKGQLDELTAATVRQASQGHFFLNSEEKAAIKTFQEKALAVGAELDARLDFDKLKPVYLKIYKDHFSQEEVDQLIALYQTPAGKLLASKMPLVSQESSNLLQQNVTPLFVRMRQAAGEMKQQIDASHAK